MTAYPALRKYSAEVAPRVPALKLSRNRTLGLGKEVSSDVTLRKGVGVTHTFRSSGTVVPPL